MLAGIYNFTIQQGSKLNIPLSFENPDGSDMDLTGYTARLQVRRRQSSDDVLISLTTANGGLVLSGSTITITMTAAATALLDFNRAVYDLELIPASNEPERYLQGTVTLDHEVTR